MFGQRLESQGQLKEGKFPPSVTSECSDFFLIEGRPMPSAPGQGAGSSPPGTFLFCCLSGCSCLGCIILGGENC